MIEFQRVMYNHSILQNAEKHSATERTTVSSRMFGLLFGGIGMTTPFFKLVCTRTYIYHDRWTLNQSPADVAVAAVNAVVAAAAVNAIVAAAATVVILFLVVF